MYVVFTKVSETRNLNQATRSVNRAGGEMVWVETSHKHGVNSVCVSHFVDCEIVYFSIARQE